MGLSREFVNEKKAKVLDMWLAHPEASFGEIAQMSGISYETFCRYRRDPDFVAEYDRRCREMFHDLQGLAIKTIRQAAADGNWQAAKYALECLDYAPTTKVDVTANDIKITIDEV